MTNQFSRRTLAAGAAWAAPAIVVSAAAPVYAASPCIPVAIPLVGTPGTSTTEGGSATATVNGVTLNVTTALSDPTGKDINFDPTPSQNMNTESQSPADQALADTIKIVHTIRGKNAYQEITFTFDQPVYNFSFNISDIDLRKNQLNLVYRDDIVVSAVNGATPTTGAFSVANGSGVKGSGTATDPITSNRTMGNTEYLPTETSNMSTISFNGALTSFSIRYINGAFSAGNPLGQMIFLGGFQFTKTDCVVA